MRRAVALLVGLVLGAGCTGDRPESVPQVNPSVGSTEPGLPRCQENPGSVPEEFLLQRARDIHYFDHVGVRQEYRHEDGRLVVFLLGVVGELGEGVPVAEDVQLASGDPAMLFGTPERGSWSLVWSQGFPCSQMAVVANGVSRDGFDDLIQEMGLLGPSG